MTHQRVALTDMLDAIREARAAGATPEQLTPLIDLQKKAIWRFGLYQQ